MRVAICIPSGDMVHAEFAWSLAGLVRHTAVDAFNLHNERGSLLPESRNRLVRAALAGGADWLFWLDSDMTFPPDALDRLLAHSQPIIGATYLRREAPHHLLGAPLPGVTNPDGLTAMAVMPFGCMLVRRDVFEKLASPWFRLEYDGDRPIGEDAGFCRRAMVMHYQPYCDDALTCQLGHTGRVVHTLPIPTAVREAA